MKPTAVRPTAVKPTAVKPSWIFGIALIALLLAACQPGGAQQTYSKGDELARYDFSQPASFEEGVYSSATLSIVDGVYQIEVTKGDNALWWGQWGDSYGDVIVDVDAEQMTEPLDNTYGVMCRVLGAVGAPQPVDPTLAAVMQDSTPESTPEAAIEAATEAATEAAVDAASEATAEVTAAATSEAASEATTEPTVALQPTALLTATLTPEPAPIAEGDGYLFLIQGSGSFAIMRSHGRNLTPLVDWTPSDAIKQGIAGNHLRAVCVGDYLAFYVNNTFLGDATDDTYTTGQVGLAASSANRLGTRIQFDNLSISAPAQTPPQS